MADMNRERDILLAPNEYAYVQDLTKGSIDLNVGPTKVSLSNTERLVEYDKNNGRFSPLEDRLAHDVTPRTGVQRFVYASNSQYVMLENPTKEEAKYTRGANASLELKIGKRVVIPGPATMPLWPGQSATVIDGHRLAEDEYLLIRAYDVPDNERGNMHIGMEQIVKGSETSFYIPPNGFAVVPAGEGRFVRKAVKLMDGEYCILLNPNGEKRYVKGPNMVIPEPNQTLINANNPVQRATTLKPEKGLHISVTRDFECAANDEYSNLIAPGKYKTGQELFISGKEGLFFPNENLQIIGEINPIFVAENEGIYVRNVKTGEVKTVNGPKNYLANPTEESVLERSIDAETARLYGISNTRDRRKSLSVYVPPNHAVMVVSDNARKVIEGPQTYIMNYAENLEMLALSTGTPKNDRNLLNTVFLQVQGNKVSDVVQVETQDHVKLGVKVSYRLNFENQPDKWFSVKNYVGLLCDHLSSLVRSGVQRHPLETFYSNSTEIVRDSVLGQKREGERRTGREFAENSMRVYDLEVLDVEVMDNEVRTLLNQAQGAAFKVEMEKRKVERDFDLLKAKEDIVQKTNDIKKTTLESQMDLLGKDKALKVSTTNLELELDKMKKEGYATNTVAEKQINDSFDKQVADYKQHQKIEMLAKETEAYKERMNAMGPDLVAALTRIGDQELIMKASEHLGHLSVLEGKSIQEMLKALFDGLPFMYKNLEQTRNTPAR